MKLLVFLMFFGCGMKVKHQVSGAISGPKKIEIEHIFSVNEEAFVVACENKYKDAPSSERAALVEACIVQKQLIVEELIKTLNGAPSA